MTDHRRRAPLPPPPSSAYISRHKASTSEDGVTSIPATLWMQVDVTLTLPVLDELRARPDFFGARFTLQLLLAKAVAGASLRHQLISGPLAYDLGLAVQTPTGRRVAVVEQAAALSIRQLAAAMADAVEVAQADSDPLLQPGLVTIADLGPLDVEGAAAIAPGKPAVLVSMGAVKRRPWVVQTDGEERLAIRSVCTLSLAFDHGFVDGDRAARVLTDIADSLGDPSRLGLG